VLAAFASACGPRTLVVVDPDPCFDGGTGPSCPVVCTDGGVAISGVSGCVPIALLDGLVGYWRLDDAAGSATAIDFTGRNDGTLVDLLPGSPWVSGRSAGALSIAGNGFVNVPDSPSLDSIVDQVTIMGWGYLSAMGAIDDYATIASREDGTTIDQHYHISINSRGEVPALWLKTEDGIWLLQGPKAVTRQTWVHIAGTYDGQSATLYVDGAVVASRSMTGRLPSDTTQLVLGANENTGYGITERFPGRIDDVMLYRRALTREEISRLASCALVLKP
jgi:hypothetical protein